MNLYELILALLDGNVPMDEKRERTLTAKAKAWYDAIVLRKTDPEHPLPEGDPAPPKFVVDFIHNYGEVWYIQIAIALAYIPLKVKLHALMHPEQIDESDTVG